jgi:hypothetical protein
VVIFREGCRGERAESETRDSGRGFVASESVEEGGEDGQRGSHRGRVARVVVVADRHSDVPERGLRVAVPGLDAAQVGRQLGFVIAVAAVSSSHQAPPQGVKRAVGIGVAESEAVGEQRERERVRVVGGLGGVDEAVRGGDRLVSETNDRQCEDQACPGEYCVATGCEQGATPVDPWRSRWLAR